MVFGNDMGVPLPSRLLGILPFFENFRAPIRFHIMTMFCLSVLSAYGVKFLVFNRRYLVAAIVPLLLIEYISPISVNRVDISPVYHKIADDEKAGTILEVPFFVRDGFGYAGIPAPVMQLYQTVHEKKLFSGYVSRLKSEKMFANYMNLPLLRSILLMEMGLPLDEKYMEEERHLSKGMLNLFEMDYVIVHKGYDTAKINEFLKDVLPLREMHNDEELVVYKTFRSETDELMVDVGALESIPYLFRGWINRQREDGISYAWSYGEKSVMFLNLDSGSAYELTLRARMHEALKDKRLKLFICGRFVSDIELTDRWNDYTVSLPEEYIEDGLNRLVFEYADTVSADGGLIQSHESRGMLSDYFDYKDISDSRLVFNVPVLSFSDYLNDINAFEVPLDWEQDNTKFKDVSVSIALDYVSVRKKI
jgi:hypothetical protein